MSSERQLQNERREVLKQDAQLRSQVRPAGATTMHERAQVELGQEYGGRFSRLRAEQHIVGAGPVYPKLPSNNSFAVGIDAIVGIEPPLGFSVEEMEPIETCAAVQSEPGQPPSEDQHQDGPSLVDAGPQPPNQSSFRRRI
jgi:hypothetical protein